MTIFNHRLAFSQIWYSFLHYGMVQETLNQKINLKKNCPGCQPRNLSNHIGNAIKYNYYGVCSTAAATAAKTVTVDSSFKLVTGVSVTVKFSDKNSASNPTLNVNSTGAKPLYRYGTTVVSTSTTSSGWIAGSVQTFTYDGTGWVRDYWNNTTYSNGSLGQGYKSNSIFFSTINMEMSGSQ